MCKIRTLRADEVEVRVQQCTQYGAQLLLYKDARCDKKILDETFGIFGWQDRYEVIKGNLYCTIDLWDKENCHWVSKCDCGTESNTEAEKGEASDAFKRAGVAVGIGRELYTKIHIFIKGVTKVKEDAQGQPIKDKYGKKQYELTDKYMKFAVSVMEVDEENRKITKLVIVDGKGNVVFTWENGKTAAPDKPAAPDKDTINGVQQSEIVKKWISKHGEIVTDEDKIAYGMLLSAFGAKKTADIKIADFDKVLEAI
ncbi:MAG: hypothetical protein J6V06_01500 [Clostridia bacterium]|nr:hypothetical protein [Clostridia bacterium]